MTDLTSIYESLPKLWTDISSKYNVSADFLYDIMLAICVSDEYCGTNHIELDIDKFAYRDDTVWTTLLAQFHATSPVREPLPKVQKVRLVLDVFLITLRANNVELESSYNCEASKEVARVVGVYVGGAASVDADEQELVSCYKEILSLFEETADAVDETVDEGLVIDSKYIRKLEYIAAVDSILYRVMSVEFLNSIGNINMLNSILYRDTYGKLIFTNDFLIANKISSRCVKFIQNNFRIVDSNDQLDIENLGYSIDEYFSYWQSSLVYVISLILKYYYSVFPVYTLTTMKRVATNEIYPLGVTVMDKNNNITKQVDFKNPLLEKLFAKMFINSPYKADTAIGLLYLASAISGNKPLTVSELRGMLNG